MRVLGLDIGGSSSRARLVTGDVIRAEAAAASASLTAAGPDGAADALTDLLGQLPELGGALDAVCAGAAGARTAPQTRQLLLTRLAPLTRSGRVLVVDDAALILPAAGLAEGIAVICGTGSIAVGSRHGRDAWAGGWGYLLGDEGGGYWMVRSAIRVLLARRTRGLPLGPLGADLLGAAGVADLDALCGEFYRRPQPRHWARHAPVVLDSRDPHAEQLVQQAAQALASLAAEVAGHLAPAGGPEDPGERIPVVLAGGLIGHERLQAAAIVAVRAALQASHVQVLRDPPVAGAVRLAQAAAGRP